MIHKLFKHSMIRYLAIAVVGVGLELGLFVVMTSVLHISYIIATPLSTALVIVYNWYLSRVFVFKKLSRHTIHKEFLLTVLVSIVGIVIQLAVTVLAVEKFKLIPLLGKMAAICITFFWNYWARRRFIFPVETGATPISPSSVEPRRVP
jgi:putative flippase GtrA